ncbi:MAG: hypothetical protein QOH56_1904 [Pseudonocardiales bacterium]|nr:hypothetical protein [Pseudonocardiales bacterium]
MSTQPTDPYAVLGLPHSASTAQISHAYRAQLRKHHPDTRTIGHAHQATASDIALQQILSAYAVLGDPGRRAEYDTQTRANAPDTAHYDPAPSPSRASRTGQPPIQAGPVRWHTSPPAPSPPATGSALLLSLLRPMQRRPRDP